MNRRYKLLNRIQQPDKIENPPRKKDILFQIFLTPCYSPWSLRWDKKKELRCGGGIYHLKPELEKNMKNSSSVWFFF